MIEYGHVVEPETVRFERLLPGPIERVWAYLTESDKRAKWLASGPMELRAGGHVELRFRHEDLSPHVETVPEQYKELENGASFSARVLRCEPPRILSYTWPGGSEVTFELTPQGDRVLLVLTHRRLGDRPEMVNVAGGWHTHLGILADHLNGRVPEGFWSAHSRLRGEYEGRIPPA